MKPPPKPVPRASSPRRLPPPDLSSLESSDELTIARPLRGAPTVALAVTGSIAAYKSAILARLLKKEGMSVVPIMTPAAEEFLGAATLSGILGTEVLRSMYGDEMRGELHVELDKRCDVLAIAPATADTLAKLAQGRAEDLVSALALCFSGPVVVAPAMHPHMWDHPATQRNVKLLEQDGITLIGPALGEVASGEVGVGRMEEPERIAAVIRSLAATRDLAGLRIVVTAGPTVEDLDPVRFLGNRSSGKMGFAIAERAAARGAETVLVAGPVDLETPHNVKRVDVRSAIAMRSALWQHVGPELEDADAVIMVAAVADYRPSESHASKIKRNEDNLRLDLIPNPDILAELGASRTGGGGPVLIGFAVETESDDRLIAAALNKLEKKRVDMIVANHARDAFGKDDNKATFVTRKGTEALSVMPKPELADRILDRVLALGNR